MIRDAASLSSIFCIKSNLSAKNANGRKEELFEFLFAYLAFFADASFCYGTKSLENSPHPRLALRAIGFADVRFGISGLDPGIANANAEGGA